MSGAGGSGAPAAVSVSLGSAGVSMSGYHALCTAVMGNSTGSEIVLGESMRDIIKIIRMV